MNFEFIAGNLALDFANTVHCHGLPDPQDDLKACSDLAAWGVQAGVWAERDAELLLRKAGAVALQRSRRLRAVIYDLFAAIAGGGRPAPEALAAFNAGIRAAMAQSSVQKSGNQYELGCGRDVGPLDRLRFAVTRSALELLTSGRLERVRQCSGEACSWLFLDTSRNGKRRWCDMRACGNRAKLRRFRQRHP